MVLAPVEVPELPTKVKLSWDKNDDILDPSA